jgi:hypothetical protein
VNDEPPGREQGSAEQGVEQHLVVQRPAERIDRLEFARSVRHRPEQIGGGDPSEARNVGVHQCRRGEEHHEEERGRGPVERHDPRDPPGDEEASAVGAVEQPGRGMHHDEAGDDEEQVDAGGPRQGMRGREAGACLGCEEAGIALDVMDRDHQRRERAQDLDAVELGQGGNRLRKR